MQKKLIYLLAIVFMSTAVFAQQGEHETTTQATEHTTEHTVEHEGEPSLRDKIKEDIQHHLQDSHDFVFLHDSEANKHYGFHLPVILWDNGLKIFSSSKFHYGEEVAEVDGNYYKLHHGKIYKTDAKGSLEMDEHHHPLNEKPLDFSITKSVLSIMIMAVLMLWLFTSIAKSYKKNDGVPKGITGFLEPIILFIRDDIARPNIGEKHYAKYMNYLLTVFFFVWFFNLVGLMPFGINITGNIAITFGLSIITFLITQFTGKKTYWLHIFDPLGNTMPWYGKLPIYLILVPIEILGVFIKPFALMIRLYANISAGHIVLMSLLGLMFVFYNWIGSSMSFLLAFVISIIEILVALLQAYIFTMLSALYFGFAVEEHDDH